jgi:alpha-mannosidase
MEVGGITATFARASNGAWITKIDPTQTLYSWIFNNHWFTNYKASQSGILTYRYSLQTHHAYDALDATRFGIERSQPLQVFPAAARALAASRMTVEPNSLIVTAFKSSDDGQALIVRFFNPSDAAVTAQMKWSDPQPAEFWQSDMSEKQLKKIDATITVPAWSLLTVRAKE